VSSTVTFPLAFSPDLQEGSEFALAPRAMTRERMRWYVDTQATAVANDGKPRFGGPTIHDDDDYARKNGLPGIVADGMVSTNWILSLLVEIFGPAAVSSGRLRTKYIKPIYEDDVLTTGARIGKISMTDGRKSVALEVWCRRTDGVPVTVGEALVNLPVGRTDG
tara:strand:+ start:6698 stop:7189 length:492 start_codon:yes stop_codon:yes gene_type:complete